jgi:hypothetical protein
MGRVVRATALLAAGALVLVGCGSGSTGPKRASSPTNAPKAEVPLPTTTSSSPPTTTASMKAARPTANTALTKSLGCVFASEPDAVPAFCDTFAEGPEGDGSRAGQLNGVVWGVSRYTGNQNFGSSANDWALAKLSTCGSTALVSPPDDVQVCDGRLVDTVNDGGTVTALAMYPKQPFDFAGRTGIIAFDVSNDSQGSHAAWPELWMSDQPVPVPFIHEGLGNLPQNGFGIRFAGCSSGPCLGTASVDSAVVVTNHVANDSFFGGSLVVHDLASVKESQPGQMNHYEVQVSQHQIEVYATNAFSGTLNLAVTPLVHIATIPNLNLNFTRGLVWLEDAHYNANKFNTQRLHTFFWDDLEFDGPVLPRDLGFDVPDNHAPDNSAQAGPSVTAADTGYFVASGTSRHLTVPGVTGVAEARGALLTFDYRTSSEPATLTVAVNGHTITVTASSDTLGVPVPLSDINTGNNTVTFTAGNYGMNVMNIDLIMQGAGGIGGLVAP